ncbi:MAG: carbamoyl-phosphate synthase large subunit [Candidatus Puniceispirillales bacterium]|jgi:carbamoyl-phosphate synthase large subunit|tara:strand:+ start:2057 stop:5296 length:3240 start_codon:yes stop_codon:yes gene_type:complete
MPKRTDIKSILIIGAGPIIIGQACEFDYSGAQACKALKEEGYRVILINSNPATIMTDPMMADATYIEPINKEIIEKIIKIEKPDAILPTMGGQTALNVTLELFEAGILEKYKIELIGAKPDSIKKAEDRELFKECMNKIGLNSAKAKIAKNIDEAKTALEFVGLPAIIRPSFTLGGEGGGIAYNTEEFIEIVLNGIKLSPNSEVLIEESLLGWKEFEMEVVRDKVDNCIIICSIENIDPMGVHTGDSMTVAPALTLTDKEYQQMRNASIAVLREIGVDTGGSNVQFAVSPNDGRLIVIEMNPRVSRSSALASKATGFPIAKIAAKLAVGYNLDELQNDITKSTPASFEPTIDYVVTKIPRFTFEKFPGSDGLLSTSMRSVGEVMAIGRSFQESLQKALRSLETGLSGLDEIPLPTNSDKLNQTETISGWLAKQVPDRILRIACAFRNNISINEVARITGWDKWFLNQIYGIIEVEKTLQNKSVPINNFILRNIKSMGFSDKRISDLTNLSEEEINELKIKFNIFPVYKRVDTCAAEFSSETAYLYSSYEPNINSECEANPSDKKKVVILGGGPNRIGQGIEFDYCCVHAAYSLSESGYETIMINCNPETVSTDYDTSDKLYFEPLTYEDVLSIIKKEDKNGEVLGVIVQLGGQTPLKIAASLEKAGVKILGTSVDAIDLAEDRKRFKELLQSLNLNQPLNGIATSNSEAIKIANEIGFPIVIRPSYVLGGRAMEIVHDHYQLQKYINEAVIVSGKNPVLIDSFLRDAIEVDVDALSDGKDIYIAGIMEHIEEAGIHSGDSACALPPQTLNKNTIDDIINQTNILAKALNVVGLMNIQFAIQGGKIFILEVNPRASRTIPFVAKATGIPLAKIASKLMIGISLSNCNIQPKTLTHVSVKEAVFPFSRFPGTDIILGPEMKSTGEVMGIGSTFGEAFAKSQLGASINLPIKGQVFISIKDSDKKNIVSIAQKLSNLGFTICATYGTAKILNDNKIKTNFIKKVIEGRPNAVDAMLSGEIQLVINTAEGTNSIKDSFSLRQTALLNKIPYYTTLQGAKAATLGIKAIKEEIINVKSIQSYFE